MASKEPLSRRVTLEVTINGHNATDYLSPSLTDLTYTDQAGGKADEVQLSLHDRDGVWRQQWVPQKGMPVEVTIVCHDWFGQGDILALPCGQFKIDEIEYKGPPATLAIKAVSASLTGNLRDNAKTRAWENKNLQDLAGEIAQEHGLELLYQGESPTLGRVDQRNESDLEFVQRVALDNGMACKVHDGKLALYSTEQAEAQAASLVVKPSGENEPLTTLVPHSWTFKEKSAKTGYDKASVSYTDPKTGTTHMAEVQRQQRQTEAGVPKTGAESEKTLTLEQRVEDTGAAIALGKGSLQDKNEKESTCDLDFAGDPRVVAGITMQLEGFGRFGGKYLVKKATHKVRGSGGYTTSVELTRCGVTSGVWAVRATDEALPATPRTRAPERVKIVLDAFNAAAATIEAQKKAIENYANGFGGMWGNVQAVIDHLTKPPLPDPDEEDSGQEDGQEDGQQGGDGA